MLINNYPPPVLQEHYREPSCIPANETHSFPLKNPITDISFSIFLKREIENNVFRNILVKFFEINGYK